MSDLILCYSDTHLRSTGSFPPYNIVTETGLTKELQNMIKGFKFVANQILEYQPKMVVNCGDTFHNTEYVSSMTLHGAGVALGMIAKACREVGAHHIIIPGNHDILIQDPSKVITSITPLTGFGDICFNKHIHDLGGFRVGFVPYNSNSEIAYSDLLELQSKTDLMITHLDFAGGKYDSGKESLSSLNPNFDVPVISGDLHTVHQTGSVAYVGSLVQHKFSSWNLNLAGGILLFDTETKGIRRVRNTFSKHYVKYDFDISGEKPEFSPDEVVLQVFSEKPQEEVAPTLEGYEYYYIRKLGDIRPTNVEGEDVVNIENPNTLLRGYIQNNNPDALDQFDRVIRAES